MIYTGTTSTIVVINLTFHAAAVLVYYVSLLNMPPMSEHTGANVAVVE